MAVALPEARAAGNGSISTGLVGLHVERGQVVDARGRTVLLRGVNAVGKEGSKGTGTPNLTRRDVARLKRMGVNSVRLGMTWDAVEPTRGRYDDAFLSRFVAQLDLLHQFGLLAIVDMHQDTWSAYVGGADGAPRWAGPQCNVPPRVPLASITGQFVAQYASPDNVVAWQNFWADGYGTEDPFCTGPVQTAFVAMWAHVARRLAAHPAVIGYDLLNEPFPASPPGVFDATQLSAFYKRTAAAIRAVDRRSMIFFEPPLGALPCPALTAPDPNSVFAPHLYTETMFSGGAVSTDARTDAADLQMVRAEADRMGTALWIGEWGEVENPDYDRQMYDLFESTHTGDAFWAFTQGGNDHLKARGQAADAGHTRPYVMAWDGDLVSHYDPGSRSLSLVLTTSDGTHRTVIAWPRQLGLRTATPGVSCSKITQRCVWTVHGAGQHELRAHA